MKGLCTVCGKHSDQIVRMEISKSQGLIRSECRDCKNLKRLRDSDHFFDSLSYATYGTKSVVPEPNDSKGDLFQEIEKSLYDLFTPKTMTKDDIAAMTSLIRPGNLLYGPPSGKYPHGFEIKLKECECGGEKHGWTHSTWCPKHMENT